MKKLFWLAAIPVIIILGQSCRKIETLPTVPRIEYRSFEVFDTTDILGNDAKGGRLIFYFEDGDGDIGLEADLPDDTSNLEMSLYRKINGTMLQAPADDPLKPSAYRIPYMEREGQNKILKGTISVTFLYLFYSISDTIQYEFSIIDRALNESNKVMTGEIVIAVNNKY